MGRRRSQRIQATVRIDENLMGMARKRAGKDYGAISTLIENALSAYYQLSESEWDELDDLVKGEGVSLNDAVKNALTSELAARRTKGPKS